MKWDGKGERPDGFRFEELDDTELARICEKEWKQLHIPGMNCAGW